MQAQVDGIFWHPESDILYTNEFYFKLPLNIQNIFKSCLALSCVISHFMEKAMAPHSSTFAWRIPWMEGPGGLQSMGSRRVGHD